MRHQRTYWICQIAGWGLLVLGNLMIAATFQALQWQSVLSFSMMGALGLGLTHLYRAYVRRRRWVEQPLLWLIPRVLGASVLIAVTMTVILGGVSTLLFDPQVGVGSQLQFAVMMVFNLSITALGWSLIYFGLHYFWNYKQAEVARWRLEATVKEAELSALKAQLNPHFLFNSLNSLRALIVEDPSRAQEAVTQLAALLRYALQASEATTVPLEKELETVRIYLDLERIRLEERLQYRFEVDPAVRDVPVPTMLLQTLVENAIKHGIATRPGGGSVLVAARRSAAALTLEVVNSGRLGASAAGPGVGLRNARERLHLLFGEAATLTLEAHPDETVAATVTLPLASAAAAPVQHDTAHTAAL